MITHDSHSKQHPETFDDVIARGFPLEQHAHRFMLHTEEHHEALISVKKLAATEIIVQRKNASTSFSAEEQSAFRAAVQFLVDDGTYEKLVKHHMNMSHNMHGSMGEVGLYRFLAWHRRYLVEFERELQRADAMLRPSATERLGIPYWTWSSPFPSWLDSFLPAKDPNTGKTVKPRKNAPPPEKANLEDIKIIVNGFKSQETGLIGENEYTKFTYGLEGWGKRPNGTNLPAHNHGHAWIGGIMNNTSSSPTDPIFWLHHAEVDRLWEIWRQTNAVASPLLNGADRIMDPWAESYDDLLEISLLGYKYVSLTLNV